MRRPLYIGVSAAAIIALAAASLLPVAPRVLYNPSASAPIGFYSVEDQYPIRKGARVAAYPPKWARDLAAERGYLPKDLPVLKKVWGEPGDHVCAELKSVAVDGRPDIPVQELDSLGRKMPRWNECRTLKSSEYFLVSDDVQTSFDSRYFGPVNEDQILGTVRLIWAAHGE